MFKKIGYLFHNAKELFALISTVKQLAVVIIASFSIIMLASFFTTSVGLTYEVFIDPPALAKMSENPLLGFLLMLMGLISLSFIISVISSSMENTFRDIRKGRLNYYGKEHTLIINYNSKIEKILQELDVYNNHHNKVHDVIILINDDSNIEKLQDHIENLNYKYLRVLIRYGDTLEVNRYLDLSILNVRSIILLSDENFNDSLSMHNHSLRIVKLLFSNQDFKDYVIEQKENKTPIKAIVEFFDTRNEAQRQRIAEVVDNASYSLFRAVFAKEIVSNIVNISMIDISLYNLWSKLLSFEGYSIYFESALNYLGKSEKGWNYKDILLRQKQGLLLGLSRFENNEFKLLLNAQDETINEGDWLIFIAKDKNSINCKAKKIENNSSSKIEDSGDSYVKNILIIGKNQDILKNNLLDSKKSNIINLNPSDEELYCENFHKEYFAEESLNEKKIDVVVMNLNDEKNYRIALSLQLETSYRNLERFIFLVDNSFMVKHIELLGIRSIIVPNHLVSSYMTQVSNQIALYDVLNMLFVKDGAEINFIDIQKSFKCQKLLKNIDQLKVELVNSDMLYLGCENYNGDIIFEANDLSKAKKIIVFSNGEF